MRKYLMVAMMAGFTSCAHSAEKVCAKYNIVDTSEWYNCVQQEKTLRWTKYKALVNKN